jgi:hypothetical protein
VTIQDCVTTNNGEAGVYFDTVGSGDHDISDSNISGNAVGLRLDSSVTVVAEDNWWGDDSGPSHPGSSGTGNAVQDASNGWLGNVDFSPHMECVSLDKNWIVNDVCENEIIYWVAAAARTGGTGGTQWFSSLSMHNRSSSEANVDVKYHRSNGDIVSKSLAISGGNHTVIDDVVTFVGSAKSGSLEVISDRPLIVGSRTYNQGVGTFGQFLPGLRSEEGLTAGETVRLTMLEQSPDFRTNIGATNTGSQPATVTVRLYNKTGKNLVHTFSMTIQPGRNKQENEPFLNRAGRTNIQEATATVTVDSGTGVLVYASVVDQTTGDATTIPMVR